MSASTLQHETVLSVEHWTDRLFSFRTTRDPGFRFRAGQFVMIGLMVDGKPMMRAYSVGSAPWDDSLEFLSIKVQDGPLTSRLQHITPGSTILVGRKPVGTLLLDSLKPGKRLWLLGTGTGLAPFLSIVRDPETYERFEQVFLVHGVRTIAELAYRDMLERDLKDHELLGEMVRDRLVYYPTVTREPFENRGRITDLIASGRLFKDVGVETFSPEEDKVMLCGSPEMVGELRDLFGERKFAEGSAHTPGDFVFERAFVDK